MSTVIRVSYERPEELQAVIHRLEPLVSKTKLQPAKGRYRLAYLTMKVIPKEQQEQNE